MARFLRAILVGALAAIAYLLYAAWRKRQAGRLFARPVTPYEPVEPKGS